MRNRFISDYIFELTGKLRTPKQVGSRLQQLRDTCKSEQSVLFHPFIWQSQFILLLVLRLLIHKEYFESGNLTPTSTLRMRSSSVLRLNPIIAHVQVYLKQDPSHCRPRVYLSDTPAERPQIIRPSAASWSILKENPSLLPFSSIGVKFSSEHPLAFQTNFTIFTRTSSRSLHTEDGTVKYIPSPVDEGIWVYTSDIAPLFWERLRTSSGKSWSSHNFTPTNIHAMNSKIYPSIQ